MSKRCLGCMETYGDAYIVCPHCGFVEGTPPEEALHIDPGMILRDRYVMGKVLGFGGFGVTYLAWDAVLEQKVAVKEYLPSEFATRAPGHSRLTVFSGDKEKQFTDGMKKFVDEAKRLARFHNCRGIVKVYDSFEENGTAYIVMEYLDGETLAEYINREGKIEPEKAVSMMRPIMESLQTVHAEGILHRDIAPDNIFLTKDGQVKLIDFGAARFATTSYSRSLTVIIKPGYSPEEQYRSRGDQGAYTDVYAVAATLYKMITGITPPDAMERRAFYETKKKDILEPISRKGGKIDSNCENAILNAMNIRIEDRTPDMAAFISELSSETPVARIKGAIRKIDVLKWPVWLKASVTAALALLLTSGVLLMTGVIRFDSLFSSEIVIPEGFVEVPSVEGMGKDDAVKMLAEVGLNAAASGNVDSEYVETGKILLQTPYGGTYIEAHGTVGLTVSAGGGVVESVGGVSTVPYVVWNTEKEAREKLEKAGLGSPEIEYAADDTVPEGSVISQSVEAGEQVDEGTVLTLVISTGPAAFEIPNVTGKTEAEAENLLSGKGLAVHKEYEKASDVPEGRVIRQNPTGGEAQKGDSITIVISSGKPILTVPNVTGKTETSAKEALAAKKFKTETVTRYDNNVAAGTVISQTPAGGSSQIEGTTVVLVVSLGDTPVDIHFELNGGTCSTTYKRGYATQKYGTLPVPTRDYHTFVGWYYASDDGIPVTANSVVPEYSSVTLYAIWEENKWSDWTADSSLASNSAYTTEKKTQYRRYYETTIGKNENLSYDNRYSSTLIGYTAWEDVGWKTTFTANIFEQYTDTRQQSYALFFRYPVYVYGTGKFWGYTWGYDCGPINTYTTAEPEYASAFDHTWAVTRQEKIYSDKDGDGVLEENEVIGYKDVYTLDGWMTPWYWDGVSVDNRTEYYVQQRKKIYKIEDPNWYDVKPSGNWNTEQTRTMYRYRKK